MFGSTENERSSFWSKETDPLSEHSFPLYYSMVIYPICVMGLFGNCLSLYVFLDPTFRHLSINILLGALSFFDFFLLLTILPNFFPDYLLPSWLYVADILYLYPVAQMFHCSSIWLLCRRQSVLLDMPR